MLTAHREHAPSSVACYVVTISDSRTPDTDTSGDAIVHALATAGHHVAGRQIVPDDPVTVAEVVSIQAPLTQVVITTGGTGITSRDSTWEAVTALFDKQLDGFGELFRMLSFREIGAAAMLSRACAGTIGRTVVFALPGSEPAVRLAMTELILPELGHIVRELER